MSISAVLTLAIIYVNAYVLCRTIQTQTHMCTTQTQKCMLWCSQSLAMQLGLDSVYASIIYFENIRSVKELCWNNMQRYSDL